MCQNGIFYERADESALSRFFVFKIYQFTILIPLNNDKLIN